VVPPVDPLQWPVSGGAGAAKPPEGTPEDIELTKQLERHKKALKRAKNDDGVTENNYERAIRYLFECGFLNATGRKALETAIEIDRKSQQLLEGAPGCGGFLMQFSLELQRALDEGDAATAELNKNDRSMFDQASDNGAFNEIVGSHSLMSKDTLRSPPFFDEARVLASVASSSVFHIMLQQVSTPGGGRRMPWQAILHHFIRYPPSSGGWERQAMDLFHKNNGRIPSFAELSELARVAEAALRSQEALAPWQRGKKDEEMKLRYVKLEGELSKYRYP
jgi:hypothetical protein